MAQTTTHMIKDKPFEKLTLEEVITYETWRVMEALTTGESLKHAIQAVVLDAKYWQEKQKGSSKS